MLVERRVDGVVRRDEADGVAVGRRCQHVLHADIAAGADVVLDDELLVELFRQILAEDARDGVVGPAGGERNDETHRPRRIIEAWLGPPATRIGNSKASRRAALTPKHIMTFPLPIHLSPRAGEVERSEGEGASPRFSSVTEYRRRCKLFRFYQPSGEAPL